MKKILDFYPRNALGWMRLFKMDMLMFLDTSIQTKKMFILTGIKKLVRVIEMWVGG